MLIKVYNQEGKEVGETQLPAEIFGLPTNNDLVHQAVVAQMANSRQILAHTKDRSEVKGGGKKPWRQKGTGRARHGSIRSPIWRGGGVTFGPTKNRNFAKKINKKMKRKALLTALSGKAKDKEIIVLDELKITEPKTKLMARVFDNLAKIKKDVKKGAMVLMVEKNENVTKAARNIPKLETIGLGSLNIVDVLRYKYLILIKDSIDILSRVKSQVSKVKISGKKSKV
jgi:large subunit ribosomal protein L4